MMHSSPGFGKEEDKALNTNNINNELNANRVLIVHYILISIAQILCTSSGKTRNEYQK